MIRLPHGVTFNLNIYIYIYIPVSNKDNFPSKSRSGVSPEPGSAVSGRPVFRGHRLRAKPPQPCLCR